MKKSSKKSMSCFNQAGSKKKKRNKKTASLRKDYQREISGKQELSVLLTMRTKLNQQRNEFSKYSHFVTDSQTSFSELFLKFYKRLERTRN